MFAEARQREAEEYFRREQWTAAACAFGEASASAKENPELLIALSKRCASAALRAGDAKRAEAALTRVLELRHDVKSVYRRGVARLELRDWDGARKDLRDAAASNEVRVQAAATRALEELEKRQAEPPPVVETKPVINPPKYLTAPKPKAAETKPKKGFLLVERARQVVERRKKDVIVVPKKVLTTDVNVGIENGPVEQPPRSVFCVAGAEARPELAFPENPEVRGADAVAAALGAALVESRAHKDEARRLAAAGDHPRAVEACDRALAIAEPVIARCRAASSASGVRIDRVDAAPCAIEASQARARATALAAVGARACLIRGESNAKMLEASASPAVPLDEPARRSLVSEATAALWFSSTTYDGRRTHRDHERLAREAYVARAQALRSQGDDDKATRDELKAFALDPWNSALGLEKVPVKSRLFLVDVEVGVDVSEWLHDTTRATFVAKRPGEKFKGNKATLPRSSCAIRQLEHANWGDMRGKWAPAPLAVRKSAAAGDRLKGGPLHLFLFANDGCWTGGRYVCVSRTCGANQVALDAATWLGLRHECACSYTLYGRDGVAVNAELAVLPQFSWLAVGDDFNKVWDQVVKTKLKEPKYVEPAKPKDVARKWRIPEPLVPRRHARWLAAGRLLACDFATGFETALSHLANGRAVVLRQAHLVPNPDRLATLTAFADADDDAWWRESRDFKAPRGVFDDECPEEDVTLAKVTDKRLVLRRTLERLGRETPLGAVESTTARTVDKTTLLPVRHDDRGLVFAQCTGTSRFIVFDPLYHACLYAYPFHHRRRRYSRLGDLSTPDVARYPLSAELRGVEVDLAPGDALVLPRGWWRQEHAFKGTSVVVAYRGAETKSLAGVAAALEVDAAKALGKRNVADFVADLRGDILDSGWQPWHDADAGPSTGTTNPSVVAQARRALGDLLGHETLEYFASHYLSAARWLRLTRLDEASAAQQETAARRLRQQHAAIPEPTVTTLDDDDDEVVVEDVTPPE